MNSTARVMTAALVISIGALVGSAGAKEEGAHWRYSGTAGPARWGDMKPEFATCKTGKRQSPIDIKNAAPADLPPITFAYRPAPLKIIDNGHTVQVNVPPGSSIGAGGKSYELVQFHFHKPSEEKVNGKAFDMVVHLVHKSPQGQLAVVGVLLEKGKDHPLVRTLWSNLPKVKEREVAVDATAIDPSGLLPADRRYYTFPGSLTTPPCTEGVTWYVLRTPVEISGPQIERFGKIYRRNARPVQPLNDRAIQTSK